MELSIDQTLVLATGNGETDTATGCLHDTRTTKNVIVRDVTDHVDHCNSPSREVDAATALSDIAFYGSQDDYSVTFRYEPDETVEPFRAYLTVTIVADETTITYNWTE